MFAPTAPTANPQRITGLMVATNGRGVTVVIDGSATLVDSDAQLHRVVEQLATACRRDEESLWRAHVRLGAALEQIAEQVRWGSKKTVYARFGVNRPFGERCRRLARALCDHETWIVDERALADRIAESKSRERTGRGADDDTHTEPHIAPHTQSGELVGAPTKLFGSSEQDEDRPDGCPDEHDVARANDRLSLTEIEVACAMRKPRGRRRAHDRTHETNAHTELVSPRLSPPLGPARVHGGAGSGLVTPAAPGGNGHTARAPGHAREESVPPLVIGEQIEMAGLYELAGRARAAAGLVMGLTDSELIDRLGSMGVDGLESVVEALESIARTPGG